MDPTNTEERPLAFCLAKLWRYPLSRFAGERLVEADITVDGILTPTLGGHWQGGYGRGGGEGYGDSGRCA